MLDFMLQTVLVQLMEQKSILQLVLAPLQP